MSNMRFEQTTPTSDELTDLLKAYDLVKSPESKAAIQNDIIKLDNELRKEHMKNLIV